MFTRLAGLVLVLAAVGCGVEVARDLDGAAANEVIVELDRHGIAADKVGGDAGLFRVTVARGQLAAAAQRLQAAELPRPSRPGVQATFGKSSLIPTPLEERARLYAALGSDLERTLELFPAVERARVHLSIDTLAGLAEAPPPPSAAIVLRLRPRGEVNAEEIKRIVAKAAVGLDPARIDLVTTRAPADAAAPAAVAPAPGRERSVYLALFALFAVVFLSMGMLWALRRLQQERSARRANDPRLQPG